MERSCKRARRSSSCGIGDVEEPLLPAPAALCTPEDIFNLPLTEDVFVVDTRPSEAFTLGHLPGAVWFSPKPAAGAPTADPQFDVHAASWVAAQLELYEPEQKSRAVVLGDPAAAHNREVLIAIVVAIRDHPCFSAGRLKKVLVLEHGHVAVAAKYPFLSGKEWNDLPAAYPSQVQPQLFLGSQTAARSKLVFEHLHISAVVNAARELANFHEGDETLRVLYLNLALDDDPLETLEEHIEQALPFITSHLQAGRSILVHCQQGQSRSVSIVLAHLMSTLGCGYDRALALVRHARPAAKPNQGFEMELRSLEGRLIYGPMP